MKYQLTCQKCNESIWVHGVFESDTNALVLDDNDCEWDNGCEHLKSGDYQISEDEQDDDMGFPNPGSWS
jgi:hypothetical protein